MDLEMDADVKAVAEFMQHNMAASRLVGVATAIGRLAPILWGRYLADDVQPLNLRGSGDEATCSVSCDPHTPPTAIGSRDRERH